MEKLRLIVLLVGIVFAKNGYSANIEMASAPVYGNNISGATFTVQDPNFLVPGPLHTDVSSFSYVRLGLLEQTGLAYFGQDKLIKISVSITTYNSSGAAQTPFSTDLIVNYGYDGSALTIDGEDYRMDGVRKFDVVVTAVWVNTVLSASIPDYVFLEGGFSAERYYAMDITGIPVVTAQFAEYDANGGIITTCPASGVTCAGTDEIMLGWDYVQGAEYYELEWTWVDNYSNTSLTTPLAQSAIVLTEANFARNSTRIRTGDQNYSIPQVFALGYLIYRVRGVGVWQSDTEKELFGRWSSYDAGTEVYVSDWTDVVKIAYAHEAPKNWQYQATYAEDGKKKEVTQYFDGSLRGRQTVTRINSDEHSVVGETVYDNEGRGVIQILPVPQDNPAIKYYPKVNLGAALTPYNHHNFDWEENSVVTCVPVSANALLSSAGAGEYYSAAAHTSDTDWQQYVPESNGYAFTQVEYTPDNTGRIRNQSGVGNSHKIGSGNETFYYYSQPAQEELNRLFGYKVGFKKRYKKNLVLDANGQISISYLDAQGRVIATSLAGDSPTVFEPLDSEQASANHLTVSNDLLNKLNSTDVDTDDDDNMPFSTGIFGPVNDGLEMNTQLPVIKDNTSYDFTYDVSTGYYSEICNGTAGVSYPYVYDLKLSLIDDCGNEEFVQTYDNLIGTEAIGSTVGYIDQITFINQLLEQGTYTLHKELKINESALANYKANYLLDGNPCLLDTSDFVTPPSTDCGITCEECVEELGTLIEFLAQAAEDEGAPLDAGQTTAYTNEYNALKDDCLEPCLIVTNCRVYYEMMKMDVSPNGQYGGSPSDPLSVFNTSNSLGNAADYDWKSPSTPYVDEYGNADQIEAYLNVTNYQLTDPTGNGTGTIVLINPEALFSVTEFLSIFQPSWAESLIPYHPEYALLTYSEEICNDTWAIPTNTNPSGTIAKTSEEFDDFLRNGIYTFDEANDGVTGNVYNIDFIDATNGKHIYIRDPYFNISYSVHNLTYPTSPSNFDALKTGLMEEAIANYQGNGYTMLEFAYLTAMSPNNYSASPTYFSNWTNIDANTTTAQQDAIWNVYKAFYLSTKGQINQYLMDMYGYNETDGIFNGCIGNESMNFGGVAPFNYSTNYTNMVIYMQNAWDAGGVFLSNFPATQPTDITSLCSSLYNGKQRRVVRMDELYNASSPSAVVIAEGAAEADQAYWQQTGLCPLTFDMEMFLNAAGTAGNLNSTFQMFDEPTMTPDLYEGLMGTPPVVNCTLSITGSINGTTNKLEMAFSNGTTTCKLEMSDPDNVQSSPLDWDNYENPASGASEWHIYGIYNSYPTGTNNDVQVIMLAGTSLSTAQEFVVTYSNDCANLNACQDDFAAYPENDPSCQTEEEFEGAMLNLIQQVIIEGQFANSSYDITSKTYYSNSIIPSIIGSPTTSYWSGPNASDLFKIGYSAAYPYGYIEFDMTSPFPTGNFTVLSFDMVVDNATNYIGSVYITTLDDLGAISNLVGTYYHVHAIYAPDHEIDFSCPCEGELIETVGDEAVTRLEVFFNDILLDTDVTVTTQPNSFLALDPWTAADLSVAYLSNFDLLTDGSGELYVEYGASNLEVSLQNDITPNSSTLLYISNSAYNSTDGFTCLGHFADGSTDPLTATLTGDLGLDRNFTLACDTCTMVAHALVSCTDAFATYNSYMAGVTYALTVTEDDFCQAGFAYIINAYKQYLDDFAITTTVNVLYLTIAEFGSTSVGYSESELALAVTAYYNSVYSDPTLATYLTWNEYVGEIYLEINMICPAFYPGTPFSVPENMTPVPCDQWQNNVYVVNQMNQYQIYLDQMGEAFVQAYIEGAIESVVETFNEEHADKEYHYTLYYYDRAGNLVQTVPPKGVDRFEAADIDVLTNNEINALRVNSPYETANIAGVDRQAPIHVLNTIYNYNSLNQLVYQKTPDGGKSRFAYDALGRLVMSQNDKQDGDDQFSYSKYDALGRVIEVGELLLAGYSINSNGRLVDGSLVEATEVNSSSFPGNLSSIREEVTHSIYDDLSAQQVSQNSSLVDVTTLFDNYATDNTRNRIVGVVYQNNYNSSIGTVYESAIYYDYDVHGNVQELIQVNNHSALMANNQNVKKLDYKYDLVSGNVLSVTYQKDREDQFIHRYNYDSDNRITIAETSKDGVIFEKDAKYFYYDHGPLARTEIGEEKVQANDYAYTIQGWLKTLNGEEIDETTMMGQDGKGATLNSNVARDAFGYSLSYFDNDYDAATTSMLDYSPGSASIGADLFNGNIRTMITALIDEDENLGSSPLKTHQTNYGYDQLNRIKSMVGYYQESGQAEIGSGYSSNYSYDPNGNLETLNRYVGGTSTAMDSFVYKYEDPFNSGNNNRLSWVDDLAGASLFPSDIDNSMNLDNYTYDAIGQLTTDVDEGISEIQWKVNNKVKQITKPSGEIISFDYDAMGNRIAKHVTESGVTASTFYMLDAQGNQMNTYLLSSADNKLYLTERNIYGSSRVGLESIYIEMLDSAYSYSGLLNNEYGDKRYEMSNHLGNVLEVVTDRKLPVELGTTGTVDYYLADVVSFSDYYPFGMTMPGRSYVGGDYRYGFQGQESDDEIKGEGNSINYTYRMHDPRIGRFFAVDPLADDYPFWSPYVFSGNQIISTVELEGLEPNKNLNENEHSPTNNNEESIFNDDIDLQEITIVYDTRSGATFGFVGPVLKGIGWLAKGAWKLISKLWTKAPKPKIKPKAPAKPSAKAKSSSPKSKNKLEPNKEAKGDHSTFQRGKDGKVHKYETYKKEKGTNFSSKKRYDGGKPDGSPGKPHIDRKTGKEVETPHVNEPGGNVRKPTPAEIPKGGGNN